MSENTVILMFRFFSFFWDRVYLCNSSSCSQSSLSWISKAFRVLSSRGNNTETLNVLIGQCLVEVVNAWPCHNRSLWLLNCRVTTAVTKCWCDYFWHSIWEKIQVRKRHQKHSTRNGKVSCWIYFHNFFLAIGHLVKLIIALKSVHSGIISQNFDV